MNDNETKTVRLIITAVFLLILLLFLNVYVGEREEHAEKLLCIERGGSLKISGEYGRVECTMPCSDIPLENNNEQ